MTQKGIEIDSDILEEPETAKMAVNQLLQTKAKYFCPKAMGGEKLK